MAERPPARVVQLPRPERAHTPWQTAMQDVEQHLERATEELESYVALAQSQEPAISRVARRLRRRAKAPAGRARSGARSFAEFYDLMSPGVIRYFARATREPQRAFDLTADTFAQAFERRAELGVQSDAEAAAWLWIIARGELARYRRSNSVTGDAVDRLGLEPPVLSEQELRELERLTAEDEARRHIEIALGPLTAEQRELIGLRLLAGLSYPEIAERLGLAPAVVRARTTRALEGLRSGAESEGDARRP